MLYTVQPTGVTVAIEVYAGLPYVDDYLRSSGTKGAVKYRALVTATDDDARKRLLVDATRYIDAQAWDGTRSGSGGTTLAFPRAGISDSEAVQLALVARSVAELVGLLVASPSVYAAQDSGSNIHSLGAGPARIEFFRPTSLQDGNASILPSVIDRLIGRYLAAASARSGAGASTGASSCPSYLGPPKRWDPF